MSADVEPSRARMMSMGRRVSEEFTQFTIKASLCVDSVGVVGADLNERLQRQMAFYTEQIGAIA